jgi:Protein of unknown function (DUF2958)
MKLLTKEILNRLPSNDDTAESGIDDLTVQVKFFNPTGNGTWYVYSYDPDSGIGYGLCDLGYPELGAVSIPELEGFRGMFGLGIERDIHFKPTPLREVMAKHG